MALRTRDEYLDAVDHALARNAAAVSARTERFRQKTLDWDIFATSDVHCDFPKNAAELESYVETRIRESARCRSDDVASAIVVAGDVGTAPETVARTLRALARCHDVVCYLPAGNHELWCGSSDKWAQEGTRPGDSIGKMLYLIDLCTSLGVCCSPIRLASVALVPIYGWYDDDFCGDDSWRIGGHYSSLEKNFDCACAWPSFINPPERARNSHAPGIGAFMADVNARAHERFASCTLAESDGNTVTVITYSHFLPRPELYRGRGNPALEKVMGSRKIDDDARRWRARVHVFGHSHLNLDRELDDVRYVQAALGYPHERWFGSNHPKLIHPKLK